MIPGPLSSLKSMSLNHNRSCMNKLWFVYVCEYYARISTYLVYTVCYVVHCLYSRTPNTAACGTAEKAALLGVTYNVEELWSYSKMGNSIGVGLTEGGIGALYRTIHGINSRYNTHCTVQKSVFIRVC